MPIEIQEIAIAVRVSGGPEPRPTEAAPAFELAQRAAVEREALIQECVRRTLRAIRDGEGR